MITDLPETQMIQRIVLGHIVFRLKLSNPINPESSQARKVAQSLAHSFNQRLLRAGATGQLPRYPVTAKVVNIYAGSSIVHLWLHTDVPTERATVTALAAFAHAYPDIRRAVLELAADIKIVAANVFGATAGMVEVQVENERLLSPAQIEASLCLSETRMLRPDSAVAESAARPLTPTTLMGRRRA